MKRSTLAWSYTVGTFNVNYSIPRRFYKLDIVGLTVHAEDNLRKTSLVRIRCVSIASDSSNPYTWLLASVYEMIRTASDSPV